ncbi:MAG: HDOD domain-containing protein [Gammaproteobacteria bacterium]|nr:HDOD domain-containing protein [Gammaproteobacteria bacterium]MBI5619024.1 HDOD domain-containing protein [Gammaproteobacteria bacterium]
MNKIVTLLHDEPGEGPERGGPSPSERIARSIINDMSALVSPPDVCLKVGEMLNDDGASAQDFADLIMRDPNLTARILKLVNSAFYGLQSKVDTVSRAFSILGTKELARLVYAVSAVQTFSKIPAEVTNINTFWRHSVYTGMTAEALAKQIHILHPERLFVAGVMHDIGTLLINARFPEVATQIIPATDGNEALLYIDEQEWLGFDHASLGAMMVENWHLPASTCDAIRWHHDPQRAQVAPLEAAVLHVAEMLANVSGTGSYCEKVMPADAFNVEALSLLGLPWDFDRETLMDEIDKQFVETIYLLVA